MGREPRIVLTSEADSVEIVDNVRTLSNSSDYFSITDLTGKMEQNTQSLTNIINALRDKGVAVSDNSSIDDIATIISGMSLGDNNIAYGTITPATSKQTQLEFYHNFGVVPAFIFIAAANNDNNGYSVSAPISQTFQFCIKIDTEKYGTRKWISSTGGNSGTGQLTETILTGFNYYMAATTEKVIQMNRNSSNGFGATTMPFLWICIKEVPA